MTTESLSFSRATQHLPALVLQNAAVVDLLLLLLLMVLLSFDEGGGSLLVVVPLRPTRHRSQSECLVDVISASFLVQRGAGRGRGFGGVVRMKSFTLWPQRPARFPHRQS